MVRIEDQQESRLLSLSLTSDQPCQEEQGVNKQDVLKSQAGVCLISQEEKCLELRGRFGGELLNLSIFLVLCYVLIMIIIAIGIMGG
jgi:hypothetical protein